MNQILHGDSLEVLKTLDDESVDLLCTDPPYGYSFMGKAWDKALPDIGIFKECLRVLKPGAFAFVMSAPRSDVCSRMAILLEDAGFNIAFTPIYWTYASGFPKAMNIGKMVDKRGGVSVGWFGEWLRNWRKENAITQKEVAALFPSKTGRLTGCVANWELGLNVPTPEQFSTICRHFNLPFESIEAAEREVISRQKMTIGIGGASERMGSEKVIDIPETQAAKALDGSYGGFQPKPAVEVVIVAMKPLSEKTYVDQALKNGKGITWLDDCRVPTNPDVDDKRLGGAGSWDTSKTAEEIYEGGYTGERISSNPNGRFPANLLVEGDVLADHSRFFSLDAWAQTLPFLAVPKASKSEKNKGLDSFEVQKPNYSTSYRPTAEASGDKGADTPYAGTNRNGTMKNAHPTVKPLKLMSYLITLGSRPGDTVLDPFLGSGTTALAAKELGRQYIGIEREAEYHAIAEARLLAVLPTLL